MNRLSIFIYEDSICFEPKNTFLKFYSQRPTIPNKRKDYQDFNGYIRFKIVPWYQGKIQFTMTTFYANQIIPW